MGEVWKESPGPLARAVVRRRVTETVLGVLFLALCGAIGAAVVIGGDVVAASVGFAGGSAVGLTIVLAWAWLTARGQQLASAAAHIAELDARIESLLNDRRLNVHVSVERVRVAVGSAAIQVVAEGVYVVNRSTTRNVNLKFSLEGAVPLVGAERLEFSGVDDVWMRAHGWPSEQRPLANPKHLGPGQNEGGSLVVVCPVPDGSSGRTGTSELVDPELVVYDAQSQETVRFAVPGSYDSPDPGVFSS